MACGEPWKTMAGQDMFVLLVYVYIYIYGTLPPVPTFWVKTLFHRVLC